MNCNKFGKMEKRQVNYCRFLVVLIVFIVLGTKMWSQSYTMTANNSPVQVIHYKNFYYATIYNTSSVSVRLTTTGSLSSVAVSPKRFDISTSISGKTASFMLPSKGYYVVYINATTKLFLFVEEPESTLPNTINVVSYFNIDNSGNSNMTVQIQNALNTFANSGMTLLFPPGIYITDSIKVPSNTKIHLQSGSVLKMSDGVNRKISGYGPTMVLIYNASNIEITGYGAFDGNGTVHRTNMGDAGRGRVLTIVNSHNVTLKSITLRDAGSWNTHIFGSEDITFQNVKVLSDVSLSNMDGIDPDCSKNILIENCFFYNGDDNIAIKSSNVDNFTGAYPNTENITVRGCVLLTHKSSLKVGTETLAANMKNIMFENNDVIEADRGMALYSYDGAVFDNIQFINNRLENVYPDWRQCWLFFEIAPRTTTSKVGSMSNILVKDCQFYNTWPGGSRILGYDATHRIQVVFENNKLNGTVLNTLSQMNIMYINGFEDISWNNNPQTLTLPKTDFLSGYAVGDSLETNAYTVSGTSTGEPLVFNTWSSSRNEHAGPNVVAVSPLTYPDYVNSAQGVGALMLDSMGTRGTVYSIPTLSPGTYYLATLFKPTQFTYSGIANDFFSLDTDGKGGGLRARVALKRSQTTMGKVVFGLNKKNTDTDIVWGTTEYDVNNTYLLVVKATVGNTPVSLYINPTKSSSEPTADISTTLTDVLSARAVVIRRKNNGYDGVISGIVLTNNWNDLWQENLSNYGLWQGRASAVETPVSNKEIESVTYYTLNGIEVNSNKTFENLEYGIYIQKTMYRDGVTKIIKVIKN